MDKLEGLDCTELSFLKTCYPSSLIFKSLFLWVFFVKDLKVFFLYFEFLLCYVLHFFAH